jgi:uncharacterized protein (DUF2225 family)
MSDAPVKVSYYLKNPVTCPLCNTRFQREEMLTGGGRLIAKDITDELRRNYEPSKKIGEVYPLNYPITVCPDCLYAAYADDFGAIPQKNREVALSQREKRKHDISLIFPVLDYRKPRNLFTGTASYILAISSYSFIGKEKAPTFKKGLSALRCAWSFNELDLKFPGQNYEKLKAMMYMKSIGYYEKTIEYAQNGAERIDAIKNFGPDLDKNYGFPGVLYISTLLLYKYGNDDNSEERIQKLMGAKRVISKVFGMGKSSKSKPSFILDISKELYDKISDMIVEFKGE